MSIPSTLQTYIQQNNFAAAISHIQNFKNKDDLDQIYTPINGKSVIDMLIEKDLQTDANWLFRDIIKITNKKFGEIQKFKDAHFFSKCLESNKISNFKFLFKYYSHFFTEEDSQKCLKLFAKNNLFDLFKIITPRLKNRDIQQIIKENPSPLELSIINNSVDIFALFLQNIAKQKNLKPILDIKCFEYNKTILHKIAEQPDILLFQKLKELVPSSILSEHINDRNNFKETPLHIAAKWGNGPLCKEFLSLGSNPYYLNISGYCPKKVAKGSALKVLKNVELGYIDPVKNISNEASVLIRQLQWQGLKSCCFFGKINAIKDHMNQGLDPKIRRAKDGYSILMMLIEGHNLHSEYFFSKITNIPEKTRKIFEDKSKQIIDFIDLLYEKNQIDFNCVDFENNNLLMIALKYKFINLPLHLLQNYSKYFPLNQKNKEGDTALDIAKSSENKAVEDAIIKINKSNS